MERLEQIAHRVGRGTVPVRGPRRGCLLREHDGIGPLDQRDGVDIALGEGGECKLRGHRVAAAGEQLARAPEEEQYGETHGDGFELLRTHLDVSRLPLRPFRAPVRPRAAGTSPA